MTMPPDSATAPTATPSNRFLAAGISIKSLRKQLKPALPKKREEASYTIAITTTATRVRFAICGAAVAIPALATGQFTVEVPYLLFKNIFTEPYEDGALIQFEFAPGSFSVNNVTTNSQRIIVQANAGETDGVQHSPSAPPTESASAPSTTIADPLDTPMGLPLLAAYKYIRTYGIRPYVVSQTHAKNQSKVDGLLDRADRLLRPVGISRSDLESLLDRKVGLRRE